MGQLKWGFNDGFVFHKSSLALTDDLSLRYPLENELERVFQWAT